MRARCTGLTPEAFAAGMMEILVTFTGWDETLAQTIHARQSYVASELRGSTGSAT